MVDHRTGEGPFPIVIPSLEMRGAVSKPVQEYCAKLSEEVQDLSEGIVESCCIEEVA